MTYRARTIFAAVGLAVLAALFTGFYVSNYKRSVEHSNQNVTVYVASKDIPEGTTGADVTSKGYLKKEQVLRQSVVSGAISSPKQVERLVAASPTYAGEQISLSRFSNVAVQGIRGLLKGPLRAVQIAGDANQTLAGTVRVGDHVDVVANIVIKDDQPKLYVTRIVLRNLRVLKAPTADAASKLSSPNGSSSVMLLVRDTQVQKLFAAVSNEGWTLELRPVVKGSDSPETAESKWTLIKDGLSPSQQQSAFAVPTAFGGTR
jgi:Flp pilus assembly protein CpaB